MGRFETFRREKGAAACPPAAEILVDAARARFHLQLICLSSYGSRHTSAKSLPVALKHIADHSRHAKPLRPKPPMKSSKSSQPLTCTF
jgi:hypothetical protein